MKRWDFANGVEDQFNGSAFNTWMDANSSALLGLTSEKDPANSGDFFSGCVAFRKIINTMVSDNSFNSNVTANGIVLAAICHELGIVGVKKHLPALLL